METVYEHVKGDGTMTVTAAERWSVSMLNRLADKYPDQVEIVQQNPDGSVLAHLPADWMRIVPKRRVDMTDEERSAIAERLRNARNAKTTVGE